MSDALTDMARDERRSRLFNDYLNSLRLFILDPTEENKVAVVKSVSTVDDVPRGFCGVRTSLARDIEDKIELLKKGDKQAWSKLLFSLKDSPEFNVFKAISPFAGKMIIAVDYGCGFVHFYGDVEPLVNNIIKSDNGWTTYDADDYLVVLDAPDTNSAEVHWIGCGISGVNGPREIKK
ncbi:hypothetical protein GW933_02690 [Candidatus Falkowbacteria bacterium]|uniref:Uncharacterized protein n=1 Tax=Candidatus Buchananbacteria bacterium CG10_big_fil_rev_8_21_14_0_10_33_19 TaxID=1974525 RepID=A0A2H0W4D8_9BACT|nr:hypothetical protein [Candidatus Falkowbacteria bacterium]PIS06218.1 MAG: hypothetical protein COT80_01445 [Candidatus Buchananbacteria bacterium CG10_big_fil_rev_8_21_14_0_10_33_19]